MPATNYGLIKNDFIIKSFVVTCSPGACASAVKRCAPKKGLEGNVERGELVSKRYRELSDPNNMLLNYMGNFGVYCHASM